MTVKAWPPRANCLNNSEVGSCCTIRRAHDSPAFTGPNKQNHAMSPHSFYQTIKISDNVSKLSSQSIYSYEPMVPWPLWPGFSCSDLMRHSRDIIIKTFKYSQLELGLLWLHVLCIPSELPWCHGWHFFLCPLSRLLFFSTAQQSQ